MFGVTHIIPLLEGTSGSKTDVKMGLTAGTYVGRGGATMPCIVTGLDKVHGGWITRERHGYTTATAGGGVYSAHFVRAAGTPGSFYPFVAYIPSNAAAIPTAGLGADATFKWLAIGEKK